MLESLLNPSTIAVYGASATPGKVGHEIVSNLVQSGFAGTLLPINPAGAEVCGLPSLRTIGAYPGTVDLGIVAVPNPAVEEAVRELLAKRARAVVVVTAGFGETGPEGALRQAHLAKLCAESGARLLGPNVVGVVNTHHRMNASFGLPLPKAGNISVIAQSGAICTVVLDWARGRHLGVGKLVSLGNKADLDEVDLLRAMTDDPQTGVVVCYLEDIRDGAAFIKAAEAVARRKPVVVLKVGASEAGRRAVQSHTGSLAGADIAYGAAFHRAGVLRAESFEALLDQATALSMQPLPRGDRVAVVTNAGGLGIIAADAIEAAGMKVARIGEQTASDLAAQLPAAASVANPLDVLGDAPPERYTLALQAALDDEGVDAVVVLLAPQAMTRPDETAEAIAGAVQGTKPVLAAFMGGVAGIQGRDALLQRGVPDLRTPERAVAALRAMHTYARWLSRPPRVVERFAVNRRRVERVLQHHVRTGRKNVGELEAKQVLRAYDFSVPEGSLARSAEQAVQVAERLGYPVVMKVHSPDIVHKSDLGGVRLDLGTASAVRDAYDLMMLRVPRRAPHARIEAVYVEQMVDRGREVILGMTRDPQFGPMLMFGLGGIFVEVMKDVTFHLAPITFDEAMEMLRSTRSWALLAGVRGEASIDFEAVARGLQRISQLATDFPQISELDINPLVVGVPGAEAVAADARISLDLEHPR